MSDPNPETVTLTIDEKSVTVPKGTTVLEAAKSAGIEIPHFCYHPNLSIAGNCRICLVDIEKSPKNQIACSTRVAPDMVVRTRSEKAIQARQGVMEFLLINHPLDCPICDQAGECVLQDYSYHYGKGESRFEHEKVHNQKQVDLGPHIVFDGERCIKCTRCIRFCDEVTGTGELGFFNRGDHSIIGTFPGQELDNAYSGCTADICPVGALTVKEFRFKSRVWFLKDTASICSGCARGCNVNLGISRNRLERITPRENAEVNQTWMCDEGRLSYQEFRDAERLGRARKGPAASSKELSLRAEAAWEEAAARIGELTRQHGGEAVAAITSGHATLEEQSALVQLMESVGGTAIALPVHERGEDDGLLIRKDKTPNAAGAGLNGRIGTSLETILEGVERGSIRGLVVLREDPIGEGDERVREILSKLGLLLVLDWRETATTRAAHLAFPLCAYGEMDGSYVNFEGRLQLLRAGLRPHQECDPAWKPLLEMAQRLGGPGVPSTYREAFREMSKRIPALGGIDTPAVGDSGLLLNRYRDGG